MLNAFNEDTDTDIIISNDINTLLLKAIIVLPEANLNLSH